MSIQQILSSMKFVLRLIFVLLLLFSSFSSFSQNRSDKLKPQWITQGVPVSNSSSYIFISGRGTGASVSEAKQQAFASMSQKLEQERGLTINTNVQISEKLSDSRSDTNSKYEQEIIMEVIEKGHKLKIVCREIDDYWTQKDDIYYSEVLYSITNKNSAYGSYADDIYVSTKYGAAGFLSIIPGVGQMYKGSLTKGCLILGGEIMAAGGILLCENTRASYVKKMTEQPKHAVEYNSLADTWETGRNICIGAAAAIYVFNLIDAFASNGAKHVIVKRGQTRLSMAPVAYDNGAGIGLALKF